MFKKFNIRILFFFILFINIKSEIEFETLNLSEEGLSIGKLTGDSYYEINSKYIILPNYIKIVVQDSLENINKAHYINHIISYYQQDSNFEERK